MVSRIANFHVGSGAALCNGCTTGHGDCGLARLSYRSLIAILTFMAVEAAFVHFTQHFLYGVK